MLAVKYPWPSYRVTPPLTDTSGGLMRDAQRRGTRNERLISSFTVGSPYSRFPLDTLNNHVCELFCVCLRLFVGACGVLGIV